MDGWRATTHGVVDDILGPRVVVNVNRHAAQGGDLGGQLIEPGVVLALALVGFRHFGLFGGLVSPLTRRKLLFVSSSLAQLRR